MIVASFGKHLVFEVQPEKIMVPNAVKREIGANYEEHKVLGAPPRLEFLAPELQTFSFSTLLLAGLGVDPYEIMVVITALVEGGFVNQLVIGGVNYGPHVLVKASEERRHSTAQGRPISIQLTLEFKQYNP